MIILIVIGLPVLIGFIWGIVDGIKLIRYKPPPIELEEDISDLNRLERIENYDRQIDGYTQLIKLLDIASREETDPKKKAVVLSKQLSTLEKLNKTIEKREKLE